MWDTDNMFLNGPFAPWREEGEAFDLEIEGELPRELNGVLYRTGSNQHFRPPDPDRYHWFEGTGMIHAVFIRDGRATYRNRYVRTEALKLEMREGGPVLGGMMRGGDLADLPEGAPMFRDPANTHVTLFNDRLLVFSADLPHELRPDTLETVGRYDFHGGLTSPGPGPMGLTPHFRIDPGNGDLLFFVSMGNDMTWYRADRSGKLCDVHHFDMGVPSWIHDYVVTPDYAIFLIYPMFFRIENAVNGLPPLIWDTDTLETCRFAVLNRHTGAVQWIDAPDAFAPTHFFNAYQDGSKVIVDGERVPTMGTLLQDVDSSASAKEDMKAGTVWRWELDLERGVVGGGAVTDVGSGFPRINDQLAGLRHNFGYFASNRGLNEWITDGVAKVDFTSGKTEVQSLDGVVTSPNEPVFVPREGATAEDDGWILTIWWDPTTDRSEVVIQDARDFTAAPVARIKLNHRVPLGFHGSWASAAELDAAVRQG
ncbi:carotenoid oxygenase family protein [Streptomyces sp. NBC_01261]|uniref:carotenoid oxygenase family protein n=1 Tax=unclassified Streptomyces TaxID=2593676 RepID=UPI002E2F091D|nr:carotenoid oxygenase family protein [Streptomyces sp. NBC_01261]